MNRRLQASKVASRAGGVLLLTLAACLPAARPARAAEFEINASSFTTDGQVNMSSVTYYGGMTTAPAAPSVTQLPNTPGGLYFDGTRYRVWDNPAGTWVSLTTGTSAGLLPWSELTSFPPACSAGQFVTSVGATLTCSASGTLSGGTAGYYGKWTGAGAMGVGNLVDSGAGGTWIAGSTLTVTGNAFSVGGSTFVVVGGNVGVGTTSPGQALDVSGGVHVSSGVATGSWVVSGCTNPNDPNDIMVPVGDLCVDKYEASVWSTPTGGTEYGTASANYPCTANGQNCGPGATAIYARSVSGVTPSAYITWFQAAIACANSGKHLLTNAEWQTAAAGTADPGATGTSPNCNVSGAGPSTTGADTNCLSSYGVMDAVGSLWEWTADWGQYGQISQASYVAWADGTFTNTAWPDASYGADGTWNVAGRSYNGTAWVSGMPAAVFRGGNWANGAAAGVFAFFAIDGPSDVLNNVGFRCGRRR